MLGFQGVVSPPVVQCPPDHSRSQGPLGPIGSSHAQSLQGLQGPTGI